MKTVQIAFYKGLKEENDKARLFDRFTCFVTKGRFSHCELITHRVGPYALCWSSSFRDGGIRAKWINVENSRWEVAEFIGDLKTAEKWFEEHAGAPYDVFGLFGFVLPWRVSYRKWWFCSESCAESIGLPESWNESPVSLYKKKLSRQVN